MEKLDGYSATRVSDGKFLVNKPDKDAAYVLEYKKYRWTCTCLGFKHWGHCCHLNLIPTDRRFQRGEIIAVVQLLKHIIPGNIKWEVAGSFRRELETSKDVDILCQCSKADFDAMALRIKKLCDFHIKVHGDQIIRGDITGIPVDFDRVDDDSWAAHLLYRTGPKEFNIRMRARARSMGYKLNQHGLYDLKLNQYLCTPTEQSIFNVLEMEYVAPTERR